MSNLVKQSQLSDVVVTLWEKVKEKTDGAFKNATYEKTTQTITFTKIDGNTIEVPLTDLASKELNNVFTGRNVFGDLFVGGASVVVGGEVPAGNRGGALGNKKFGHRGYDSHADGGDGYVNSLLIGVTKNVGEQATVSVWEVAKGTDRSGDIPTLIASNVQFTVKDGAPWTTGNRRYVEFPINKKYNSPTYFIYQVHPSTEADRVVVGATDENYVLIGDSEDVTQGSITGLSSFDILGVHALKRGEVNIIDLITGGGSVKTVNNQTPNGQGNVTIGIEHINGLQGALDDKVSQSRIGNQATQIPQIGGDGKLDASIIPELAITRVKTTTDRQSALTLIGDTENHIQTGDVVVLTGEKNAIFMYNGTVGGTFENSFIELSIGEGTVKMVNGQAPSSTGAVSLRAGVTQEVTGDIVLAVGDVADFATLQCMTPQEVQAIKDLFV